MTFLRDQIIGNIYEGFFLGAYSAAGMQGMMSSTYATRVAAVKKMVEKVGGKLGDVTYLQGPFDMLPMLRLMTMRLLQVYIPT